MQTTLRTAELDYDLPSQLIATHPVEPRDASRLLVYDRATDEVQHLNVRDLPRFVSAGDAVVVNTTSVLPARIGGRRVGSGGAIDGLFVDEPTPGRWRVMLKTNGRLHPGDRITLDAHDGSLPTVITLQERWEGGWIIETENDEAAASVLARIGRTPLPPYIRRARGGGARDDGLDRTDYQTVYADPAARHSVAAPTAGLHFTAGLLEHLAAAGVRRIDLTLHVGLGTFKPVTVERLAEHAMHSEAYVVTQAALAGIRATRAGGGRMVAVGTTSVRTLESLPESLPLEGPVAGETDLLIAPPYRFRLVDALLTNFHLPRSTLLALVAALVGLERLHELYRIAMAEEYRFYSYGDAMLVL